MSGVDRVNFLRMHLSTTSRTLDKPSLKWALGLSLMVCAFASSAQVRFAGINLFGAEFGEKTLPGNYNQHYIYPNQTEVNYFKSNGMNIVRMPFRWERLQRTNNVAFDATEFGRFHAFVSQTTAKRVYVVLDPHNFGRYYPDTNNVQSSSQGLIGSAVSNSAFADFWSRLADIYKTNSFVIFGLMNEPNTMPTEQWLSAANDAIAAIRATGATNLVLVPGNGWTGAHSWSQNWYGTPNAQAMLNIVDSANNYAYDVHQYLDSDSSGSTSNIVNAMIGATRLTNFTRWCKDNNRRGFLGEFAVDNATIGAGIGDDAISNMLSYVNVNADVWLGWTWWAAGPWFTDYMFSLEPTGGVHRAAMPVLRNFLPLPTPTLQLANGNQVQFVAWPGFWFQPQTSTDLASGVWANYGSEVSSDGITNTIVNFPVGSDAGTYLRVRTRLRP
jgi:endoglucanase